ncbi:MAG TPA: peptidoglycan DD-metalloendopeptidase family protein [Planctomycetota bacterium]|jgi:murein DD-endopeptidase MepM/ murein hydrolase activator NlpD
MRHAVLSLCTGLLFASSFTHAIDKPEQIAFRQGRKASEEGRFEEAIEQFQKVLRESASFEPMWTRNNLGYALFKLKRYEEAARVLEQALALPSKSHEPKLYINAVSNYLARDDKDRALGVCLTGVQRFPEQPWIWDNLGWIYSLQDNRADAAKAYAEACRLVEKDQQPVGTKLALPFHGTWICKQGNGGAFSHLSLLARYAWDFEAVNDRKRSVNGEGKHNKDYAGFGKEICAPLAGKVVELNDGAKDNDPGQRDPLTARGNYVVLEHGPQEFTCFFHMQRGSIAVKLGDQVQQGQRLGCCGNSGYSTEPHLHFALVNAKGTNGISRPVKFGPYTLVGKNTGASPTSNEIRPTKIDEGVPEAGELIENAR